MVDTDDTRRTTDAGQRHEYGIRYGTHRWDKKYSFINYRLQLICVFKKSWPYYKTKINETKFYNCQ